MFDDRMDEELEWIQLDLDEVSHDVSGNGLIVPICHQIDAWGIDKLLDKYVSVRQKVREKSIGQLLLSLSRHAQFHQSLLSLRL